jgi:hypothetical protein
VLTAAALVAMELKVTMETTTMMTKTAVVGQGGFM